MPNDVGGVFAELVTNVPYLQRRLQYSDGTVAGGPVTTWKGLIKPHRADRRWASGWSPEQISRRLVVDLPDDASMRISHEAIYQALYIQGRGRAQARAGGLLADRTGGAHSPGSAPATGRRGT